MGAVSSGKAERIDPHSRSFHDLHERLHRTARLDEHRSPPSFAYKSRELLFRQTLLEEQNRPDPRFRITMSKLGAFAFLDRLGVPHARVYTVIDGLEDLTPEHLQEPVVLKPMIGSGSKGVLALEPEGEGWRDLIGQRFLSFDELIATEREALGRVVRPTVDRWILEELLRPPPGHETPILDDVKCYSFNGRVGLVLLRRGLGGSVRFCWYSPEWEVVDTGKYPSMIDRELVPPDEASEVIELAEQVSRAAPFAFMRVDAFVTRDGLRVGELNSHVGAYDKFNDEWDRRLGEHWEVAEAELDSEREGWTVPERVVDGQYPLPWWGRAINQVAWLWSGPRRR